MDLQFLAGAEQRLESINLQITQLTQPDRITANPDVSQVKERDYFETILHETRLTRQFKDIRQFFKNELNSILVLNVES